MDLVGPYKNFQACLASLLQVLLPQARFVICVYLMLFYLFLLLSKTLYLWRFFCCFSLVVPSISWREKFKGNQLVGIGFELRRKRIIMSELEKLKICV